MLAVIWVCGRCVTELLKFMRGWEWKSFGIKRDIILHYGLWLLLFLGTIRSQSVSCCEVRLASWVLCLLVSLSFLFFSVFSTAMDSLSTHCLIF